MGKGSTRFSNVMRQAEGRGINGISHQLSKKLKIDQSSASSKRVKLPKKFFDDCHTVNNVPVPRKLRSAIKKQPNENVSPSSSILTNKIHKFELPSKDRNKKLKVDSGEQHLTMTQSISYQLTKDEEEAIAGLLVLVGNDNTREINLNNESSEVEASKSEHLVQICVQIDDVNESRNIVDVKKDSKDVTDGNKLRKRCSSHVYICRIIKDLQIKEGTKVISHKESKQRVFADAKTDMAPENIMNGDAGIISNEASTACKTIFQDQCRLAAASEQVSALPYFGNPFCDPSQWSRPVFPKQQMWMNPFIPGGHHQNWPNAGSGSYVGMFESKYKKQFGQCSSLGNDKNGGLCCVDSILKL